MEKKIIAKISEGLGNQLFMYANAYSLKKKHQCSLLIDTRSGYYNKKAIYNYVLNNFNISSDNAPDEYVFDTPYKNILKKIYLFFDNFNKDKKFIFEKKGNDKLTSYSPLLFNNINNLLFLDGNFESEKYFIEYKNDIINEFRIKNTYQFIENNFLKLIKTKNVISICLRQNRFSERVNNKNSKDSIEKSQIFLKESIIYINEAINYFKDKVEKPIFLIWSNDFTNLEKYFKSDDFIFVINKKNKILTDFYLLTQRKYFIVAPSTFHWWGAWLSNFHDKICVRPKNLNPSNNKDFWPESWISI